MAGKKMKNSIFISDPFIELEGFKRCQYDNECDFCKNPLEGSYMKHSGSYEHPDELDYVICGKCIVDNQKRNKGKFKAFDLPDIILPF